MHPRANRPGMNIRSGEPRTGIVSSLQTQRATAAAHSLREPRTAVISSLETQRATAATHMLESRGQASSAALKPSEPPQPLTSWRADDRRRQQPSNPASHRSHSPTGEPRTGVVSSLQTQRATPATHFLESRGQASSATLKPSEPRQPLTY